MIQSAAHAVPVARTPTRTIGYMTPLCRHGVACERHTYYTPVIVEESPEQFKLPTGIART